MPRKHLIRSAETIYHVTNRSNNKDWFYVPIKDVWEISTKLLTSCAERYKVTLHAFVLMSNHYHLIISTPEQNLDAAMRYFQTEVARKIQKRARRINHIFGTRYKWSCLWNSAAVAFAYKYVLRNPVRAGLVSKVEDYYFSSYHPKGISKVPWASDLKKWNLIPGNELELSSWLNLPTNKEVEQLITKGLRRKEFKFSQGSECANSLRLLEISYGVPTSPATFSIEKGMGTFQKPLKIVVQSSDLSSPTRRKYYDP